VIERTRVPHVPRPSRISAYVAARVGPPVLDPSILDNVLGRFGLERTGAPRNLRLGRRSRNMAVATDGGRKAVKLYRPQWTEPTVRYGHSILARLEAVDVPAPRPVRTGDGETWTSLDGGIYAVFDWVRGMNYSVNFLLRGDRLRLTIVAGRTLARLHRALEGFEPEGQHHLGFASFTGPRRRDVAWHAAALERLAGRSAELRDPDAAGLARRLIQRSSYLLEEIERLDGALSDVAFPRLVIHGDYGIHNLLYGGRGVAVPVDFELSRLDWRVNDLISALVKYRYRGGVYDFESMETFLRAYTAAFPLTPDERRHLADAWRLYKLQQAVQYWNSYFETNGPVRKLASALDSIGQAEWVNEHPEAIARLAGAARSASTAQAGRVGG